MAARSVCSSQSGASSRPAKSLHVWVEREQPGPGQAIQDVWQVGPLAHGITSVPKGNMGGSGAGVRIDRIHPPPS